MQISNEINKKKLSIRIVLIIFIIFLLNTLAMKFHWYFTVWWFDMPMHLLGGFWIGLLLFSIFRVKNINSKNITKVILLFLVIAFGWELFEVSVDKIITKNIFNILDTSSDIFFGISGVLFSVLYFNKRIIKNHNIL